MKKLIFVCTGNTCRSPRVKGWFLRNLPFLILLLTSCGTVNPDSRAGRITAHQLAAVEEARLLPTSLQTEERTATEFEVRTVKNIRYYEESDQHEEKHLLDLYLPRTEEPFPVIHFVHGGAWFFGHKEQRVVFLGAYKNLGEGFARRGIGVAISNYRLSPTFKHPAHIKDVAMAWDWLLNHIDTYGGDPERMVLMGQSAGGHLVSLLATDPSYLKALGRSETHINAVITMSGIYDLNGFSAEPSEPIGLITQAFGTDAHVIANASPIQHVSSKLPPFLIITAERDTWALRVQAAHFAKALGEKQVPYDYLIIPQKNHFTSIGDIGRDGDVTTRMISNYILGN